MMYVPSKLKKKKITATLKNVCELADKEYRKH